jgi:hypothetical protein
MAQSKQGANTPSTMTAAEKIKWYDKNHNRVQNFDNASDALKILRNPDKQVFRTIPTYDKGVVVTYLQNAMRNEVNLRSLAWYLFYRSQIFQRVVVYFSSLFDLDARIVIPNYNLVGDNNKDAVMRSYYNTLVALKNWNIVNEFFKIYVTCFIQDISYNIAYYDETGLFFLPMPADYCRIVAQYPSGDYSFAIDMSYFRGSTRDYIDLWGEPFVTMWRNYEADRTKNRWQVVPDEYAACFKYRSYDWQTIISPFSGMFLPLINLEDVADVQAVADAQEIYKMIWYELETITGSNVPDDWKVDPNVAVDYFNRMIQEALPDYTTAAMVPGKLNVIDFSSNDKTKESNKVLNSTKTVLNTSGGAQVLNSADITGTTAYNAVLKVDTEFAICTLLPQTEGWFNRIIGNMISNPSRIKFFHVGRLTREDFRKEMLENAQYGLPSKMSIMVLSGIDELSILSMNYLEEEVLNLSERFDSPLSSSFTQSSEVGRPESDPSELTDDGEASIDKRDTANG